MSGPDQRQTNRSPEGEDHEIASCHPGRGYFIVMLAVIAATYLVIPLLSKWAGVETGSGMVWVLTNKTILNHVGSGVCSRSWVAAQEASRARAWAVGEFGSAA